jgi:hypothetical protein
MSRNQKDDSPQRRAEPEQPLTKPNEKVERDPMKVPERRRMLSQGLRSGSI